MNHDDKVFEQRVRATLDSSVTQLNAETRNRLSALRYAAFEQKSFLSRWLTFNHWIPATAFAAFSVLAVTMILKTTHQEAPNQLALQDTDIVLEFLFSESGEAQDELDDPGFYVWLDEALIDEETLSDAG